MRRFFFGAPPAVDSLRRSRLHVVQPLRGRPVAGRVLELPIGTFEPDCAQVPPRQPIFGDISIPVVDAAFVRAAHARGMPVQVWTVDEEAEMERFLDLGVDAIMSDHVTRLKAVFERRDLWR